MYQTRNPILTTHPRVTYMGTNAVHLCMANNVFGSTGIRTPGAVMAACGTITSESWTSGTKEITGIDVVYFTAGTDVDAKYQLSLEEIVLTVTYSEPSFTPLAFVTFSGPDISAQTLITHNFTSSYTISPDTRLATVFTVLESGSVAPALGPVTVNTSWMDAQLFVSCRTNPATSFGISADALASIRFNTTDGSKLYYKNGYVGMWKQNSIILNFSPASTGTNLDDGDERGMLWVPKKTYDLTGFNILSRIVSTDGEAEYCLYRDTTLLVSMSVGPTNRNNTTTWHQTYGMQFDPIRVYPGDNIRLTVKPLVNLSRWYRYTAVSDEDMQIFFGGAGAETNLSLTNRVDGGAWNTPPSASASFTPVQFYGYEVTGSALLSGSYQISGSVVNQGTPISGATIRAIRQSDNLTITTASNASGYYEFNIATGSYHVVIEYESGSQKYNALSKWDVGAV